jgi:hypothetical protein
MSYLPYLSDDDLKALVKEVVDCILATQHQQEEKMYENVIDPFSAIFDGVVQDFNLEDWLKKERARQVQKTVQNKIGEFHQAILGVIPGWENLGKGKIIDLRNKNLKTLAEVKNKHNTVKGSNQDVIYDDLLLALGQPEHYDFTAYYVEIIPKNRKVYNEPFTPSSKGKRKPMNEKIRRISGQAFYDLATNVPGSLSMLFDVLPDVISEVTEVNTFSEEKKASFRTLFDRAY